ncbi:MAG: NAD(P)/FAD-dependent oxidoreductase, partial [Bradymonadaceae bacterium]
ILLDHTRSCGADVRESCAITEVDNHAKGFTVYDEEGRVHTCEFFVEASGRQNNLVTESRHTWLSSFKNVAIWTHFTGGKPPQSIEADWNIFHEDDLSAIGNFAFEDGWVWYIPVPKEVDGEIVQSQSIGVVTNTEVLEVDLKDYKDLDFFLDRIGDIPLLDELIEEVEPLSADMKAAADYSMITDQFCNYDEDWVLVGDSAHFVDPLFSSGVNFALRHACTASALIESKIRDDLTASETRRLWTEYDRGWQRVARSFSVGISQWYHAIGRTYPESDYWAARGNTADFDFRDRSFQKLVDTETIIPPDLGVILAADDSEDVDSGPAREIAEEIKMPWPDPDDRLRLADDTEIIEGPVLDVGAMKGKYYPWEEPSSDAPAAKFWEAPLEYGPEFHAHWERPFRGYHARPEGNDDEAVLLKLPDDEKTDCFLDAVHRDKGVTIQEIHDEFGEMGVQTLLHLYRQNLINVID